MRIVCNIWRRVLFRGRWKQSERFTIGLIKYCHWRSVLGPGIFSGYDEDVSVASLHFNVICLLTIQPMSCYCSERSIWLCSPIAVRAMLPVPHGLWLIKRFIFTSLLYKSALHMPSFFFSTLLLSAVQQVCGTFFFMLSLHVGLLLSSAVLSSSQLHNCCSYIDIEF